MLYAIFKNYTCILKYNEDICLSYSLLSTINDERLIYVIFHTKQICILQVLDDVAGLISL